MLMRHLINFTMDILSCSYIEHYCVDSYTDTSWIALERHRSEWIPSIIKFFFHIPIKRHVLRITISTSTMLPNFAMGQIRTIHTYPTLFFLSFIILFFTYQVFTSFLVFAFIFVFQRKASSISVSNCWFS